MRKVLIFSTACIIGMASAIAAVRDESAVVRTASNNLPSVSTVSRAAGGTMIASRASAPTVSSRGAASTASSRSSASVVSRAATSRAASTATASRTSTNTPRTATVSRAATSRAASSNVSRAATNTARTGATVNATLSGAASRAATSRAATISAATSNTFGTGYNACRDAYFTCMDQFCATANDSYRRCVCSSRLTEIQDRERALNQTSDQLQNFTNFNIDAISKTAAEVKAMSTATAGEAVASTAKDTSASASALAGIVDVLSGTKSKALSTQGTLDIAGDINAIWSTTDLISGDNIANLTGEALYNAVHAQCAQMVADTCNSSATLKMVMSAYGMYIENDCTALSNALDKQLTTANSQIRATEREMNVARLENYNAHNSSSINECVANVRNDLTADTACGTDFVHCLDITGRYLNRTTGEPIYSSDFYQLDYQLSISGDILTNSFNTALIEKLNSMRAFAKSSLDKCSDLADDVWDDFLRQAVREIYQGQQTRIRQVKNECLGVVNDCYDTQSKSIKDFSNIAEEKVLGMRLELAEEMCREKLDTCSNLYGGGASGMELLVAEMKQLTDQKIAQNCLNLLEQFAKDKCTPAQNDTLHAYPYNCRTYAPGEATYATNPYCNEKNVLPTIGYPVDLNGDYTCPTSRVYVKCSPGHLLARPAQTSYVEVSAGASPRIGDVCIKKSDDADKKGVNTDCGSDYIGSLFQQMVKYALEMCVRSTDSANYTLPQDVLGDVVTAMNAIKVSMANQLSAECQRLGGTWVDVQWMDSTGQGQHDVSGHNLHAAFYDSTGANTKWGYCAATIVDDDGNLIQTGNKWQATLNTNLGNMTGVVGGTATLPQ